MDTLSINSLTATGVNRFHIPITGICMCLTLKCTRAKTDAINNNIKLCVLLASSEDWYVMCVCAKNEVVAFTDVSRQDTNLSHTLLRACVSLLLPAVSVLCCSCFSVSKPTGHRHNWRLVAMILINGKQLNNSRPLFFHAGKKMNSDRSTSRQL